MYYPLKVRSTHGRTVCGRTVGGLFGRTFWADVLGGRCLETASSSAIRRLSRDARLSPRHKVRSVLLFSQTPTEGGLRADYTFERTLGGLWADFHLTRLNFLAKLVGDSFLPGLACRVPLLIELVV